MRFPYAKLVEAAGLTFVLVAAIWSATFLERYAKLVTDARTMEISSRLDELETLIAVDDQHRSDFLKHSRKVQQAEVIAIEQLATNPTLTTAGYLRLGMFVIGSVLIIGSKIADWADSYDKKKVATARPSSAIAQSSLLTLEYQRQQPASTADLTPS